MFRKHFCFKVLLRKAQVLNVTSFYRAQKFEGSQVHRLMLREIHQISPYNSTPPKGDRREIAPVWAV